jgi:hypothetical protein
MVHAVAGRKEVVTPWKATHHAGDQGIHGGGDPAVLPIPARLFAGAGVPNTPRAPVRGKPHGAPCSQHMVGSIHTGPKTRTVKRTQSREG